MQAWHSNIIHSLDENTLEYLPNSYLIVDGKKIKAISSKPPEGCTIHDYSGQLLLPGLIDTHTHLPQYAFAGLGTHGLLNWLNTYTFPEELKFSDPLYAKKSAKVFFDALLKNGTTTVASYLTVHTQAAEIAFEEASQSGLRAFLGLTLMDSPSSALQIDRQTAMKQSMKLIMKWHKNGRLHYIVTPRFALSCSPEIMREAGRMADDLDLLLQTHLSENTDEIKQTLKLFNGATSYTDVYRLHGCLSERTLLGHCIHLSEDEIKMIGDVNAVVVHCPTSNQFLMSGLMPLKKYQKAGLRISLGSDVAGGYELNMIHEMRLCIETSKNLTHYSTDANEPASIAQAFYYATLGGAKALRIDDLTGNLAAGKEADFIIVDDTHAWPHKTMVYSSLPERLSRIIYRLNGQGVKKVYVAGELLYSDINQ